MWFDAWNIQITNKSIAIGWRKKNKINQRYYLNAFNQRVFILRLDWKFNKCLELRAMNTSHLYFVCIRWRTKNGWCVQFGRNICVYIYTLYNIYSLNYTLEEENVLSICSETKRCPQSNVRINQFITYFISIYICTIFQDCCGAKRTSYIYRNRLAFSCHSAKIEHRFTWIMLPAPLQNFK